MKSDRESVFLLGIYLWTTLLSRETSCPVSYGPTWPVVWCEYHFIPLLLMILSGEQNVDLVLN